MKRLARIIVAVAVAFSGFAALDSIGSVARSGMVRVVDFGLVFGYMLPWFLVASLLLSLAYFATVWALGRAFDLGLPRVPGHLVLDLVLAALVAGALAVLTSYGVILFATTRFNNHHLASLLVVGLLASMLMLGACVGLFAFVGLRRLRRGLGAKATWAAGSVAAFTVAGVVGFLVWDNREGLDVLSGWLSAGPVAAVSCLVLADLALGQEVPQRSLAAMGGLLLVSGLAAAGIGMGSPRTPPMVTSADLWSARVIRSARSLTDFDRDGSSSWFGGGDCAPFDEAIHPGARDKAGDGIDSNCVGGDAKKRGRPARPEWHERPAQLAEVKNAVVVTIEAVRSDRLSLWGYKYETTPNIDELARRSFAFSRMYAASPTTMLSLPSLFSGLLPSQIRFAKRPTRVLESNPWIPHGLQRAGYDTAAWLVDYKKFVKKLGFRRGFSSYDTSTHVGHSTAKFHGFPSEELMGKAIDWLGEAEEPFFLWTHLVEPHTKYEQHPKGPVFEDSEEGRYASELWTADRAVGRLVRSLKERRLMDRTVLVLVGDHGEAFEEHGKRFHDSQVFDEQVRTLGVLWVPGLEGRVVDIPVVHADLGATLVNLLGVKQAFAELRGRSLMPLLLGKGQQQQPIIVERFLPKKKTLSAVVSWPYKLIYDQAENRSRLFDLEIDPGETRDLAADYYEVAGSLTEYLFQHQGRAPRP